ncbi:hypothetical protein LTR56_010987 [Elasticomyces elasticus]|nr:hypothetical protein LTR56_010987 [Elasticomyces elasticus]KAK3662685.1 hypothetical protein LTR22_006535 [Elasticomyces elasticus]KAK4926532.1 hypothetical protein LTR49_006466 [Elasticomyces elasticus]KAK5760624.1 hypothetical protein LTS12_009161 [Elasticomyces elasticus]
MDTNPELRAAIIKLDSLLNYVKEPKASNPTIDELQNELRRIANRLSYTGHLKDRHDDLVSAAVSDEKGSVEKCIAVLTSIINSVCKTTEDALAIPSILGYRRHLGKDSKVGRQWEEAITQLRSQCTKLDVARLQVRQLMLESELVRKDKLASSTSNIYSTHQSSEVPSNSQPEILETRDEQIEAEIFRVSLLAGEQRQRMLDSDQSSEISIEATSTKQPEILDSLADQVDAPRQQQAGPQRPQEICRCQCHVQAAQTWARRHPMSIVGQIMVDWTRCRQECCTAPVQLQLFYRFPSWMTSTSLHAAVIGSPSRWSIALTTVRVVPEDALAFLYSREGDLVRMQELLISGKHYLFATDVHGNNVLHAAVMAGQYAMVRFFVSLGLSQHILNIAQVTPADIAWDVALFTANDADVALAKELGGYSHLDRQQFTPIHLAILGLTDKDMHEVLKACPSDINRTDRQGWTPLCWAVRRGDLVSVRALLDHGADVCHDSNALMWSCFKTYEEPSCLKLLLERGADPTQCDVTGLTALQATAVNGRPPVFAEYLLEYGVDIEQTYSGDLETLHGATALSLACLSGPGSLLVKRLLEHGSNIHHVDCSGRSALHFAVAQAPSARIAKDAVSIVKTLVDFGHRVDCLDNAGRTAAHDAMVRQDTESLGVLIASGANIVWPVSRGLRTNGYHQLAWPMQSHNHAILTFLLALESVNIYDTDQVTDENLLHLLAKSADQKSIEIFERWHVDAALDPGRTDVHGNTASDYAKRRSPDVATMLTGLFERMASRKHAPNTVPDTLEDGVYDSDGSDLDSTILHTDAFVREISSNLKEAMSHDNSDYADNAFDGHEDVEYLLPPIAFRQQLCVNQHLRLGGTANGLNHDGGTKTAKLETIIKSVRALPGLVLVLLDRTRAHQLLSRMLATTFTIASSVLAPLYLLTLAAWISYTTSFKTLFRPRIRHGLTRITWTCHCGTELYADYPDTSPAEVAALSEELNNPSTVLATSSSIPSHGSGTLGPTIPAAVHQSNATPQSSSTNALSGQSGSSSGPAMDVLATLRMFDAKLSLRPKFLELCVNTGNLCQSLGEIDATRISSDVELFRWVRKRYRDLRGWRMRSRFCLQPKTMRFVRFGLEQQKKVHILCEDESFPSEDDVIKARTYHYMPCPTNPRGSPPMPSNVFIHYLHYCNLDADVPTCQNIWLNRLPKKLEESVVAEARSAGSQALVEAWGVHIIEGIDGAAVLWTTIVTLLVGIVPLLGTYIAMTGDVQSATGLASLVAAVIAILMMCIQIDLGKNN